MGNRGGGGRGGGGEGGRARGKLEVNLNYDGPWRSGWYDQFEVDLNYGGPWRSGWYVQSRHELKTNSVKYKIAQLPLRTMLLIMRCA